jgi:hypothetical protein
MTLLFLIIIIHPKILNGSYLFGLLKFILLSKKLLLKTKKCMKELLNALNTQEKLLSGLTPVLNTMKNYMMNNFILFNTHKF